VDERWETIATWATWSLPWPRKTYIIVRNVAADGFSVSAQGE
jgi:hypothetical protein